MSAVRKPTDSPAIAALSDALKALPCDASGVPLASQDPAVAAILELACEVLEERRDIRSRLHWLRDKEAGREGQFSMGLRMGLDDALKLVEVQP